MARAVEQAISGRFLRAPKAEADGSDRRNGTTVLQPETRSPSRGRLGDLRLTDKNLSGLLALAVAISVGIHTGLTPEHLNEMPRLGASFIVAAALGAAIAVTLILRPADIRIVAAAGLFCFAQILAWVLFVTISVPLFPGTPERFEWIAVVCKLVEAAGLAIAIGLVAQSLNLATGGYRRFGLPEVDAARRRQTITHVGLGAAAAALLLVIVVVSVTPGGSMSSTANANTGSAASLASLGHLRSPGPPGPIGPEGIPVPNAPTLARAVSATSRNDADGVPGCVTMSQVAVHTKIHLMVFVQGAARQIPYGIGIRNGHAQSYPHGTFVNAVNCFSALHTDAADGLIHIMAPTDHTYTLGNFFDVWGQPLGPDRVGPATGRVTALVNDKPYTGNPRDIPLTKRIAHIQLEVGTPLVAPVRGTIDTDF